MLTDKLPIGNQRPLWLVLDEIMPPLAWVGLVVAGLGIFMATTKKQVVASW